jgi:hypothetical protein
VIIVAKIMLLTFGFRALISFHISLTISSIRLIASSDLTLYISVTVYMRLLALERTTVVDEAWGFIVPTHKKTGTELQECESLTLNVQKCNGLLLLCFDVSSYPLCDLTSCTNK